MSFTRSLGCLPLLRYDVGALIDLESARIKRWERKQQDQFVSVVEQKLNWVCKCGCWQFEVRKNGITCLGCETVQSLVVKPLYND